MKKSYIILAVAVLGVLAFGTSILVLFLHRQNFEEMSAFVVGYSENKVLLRDDNNITYEVSNEKFSGNEVGEKLVISYKSEDNNIKVKNYTNQNVTYDENNIPTHWLDDGIFKQFYKLAFDKIKTMSLDEKIGQILLGRYDDKSLESISKYHLGGLVFYADAFNDKEPADIKKMIKDLQSTAKVPLITAIDEEGGTVVRISKNKKVIDEPFLSPQELYSKGKFQSIKDDTINKSNLLKEYGLNVNLAPVVDVVTDENAYMYNRSLGMGTRATAQYATTVIEASAGTGVSYVLKHFPGYGNAEDTHKTISVVSETEETIVNNYLPPFKDGIDVGAEAVMINHNIYTNIDDDTPASLSPTIHNMLRKDLNFTGIIISDDLSMSGVKDYDNPSVNSLLSGSDMIITTDYESSYNAIKDAITTGKISEDLINKLSFRVVAWKYYKGLMYENQK